MKWTEEQSRAISERGRNLMVAAAAGSGKTAVLVERIKTLILNDSCPIDRMLVVTFTNAAASEMKTKIEKAIRDEIDRLSRKEIPGEDRNIALLKRQLDLLPMANISTFHSFSMEVVKKFFYVIGCDPNYRILDDPGKIMLQDQAMDQLMEDEYSEGSAQFFSFLDSYSGDRSDNRVREMIQSLSDRMESLPFPDKWLSDKTEELNMDLGSFGQSAVMDSLWTETEDELEKCGRIFRDVLEQFSLNGLAAGRILAASDLAAVNKVAEVSKRKNYDETLTALASFKLDNLKKEFFSPDKNPGVDPVVLSDCKALAESGRKAVKSSIEGLRKNVFGEKLEMVHNEIRATYNDALFLKELVQKYRSIYSALKKEKGLMDFSDLEHFAFDILRNDEAGEFYRNKFNYIFVDEYQDSNYLQEALIQRIAGKNNLFTVGDVKQSIYGFRLAEPEIFENRYKKYKAEYLEKGEESDSIKIDLNRNFRSKQGIVDFVNEIFSETMEGYGEEEALYAADPYKDRDVYEPEMYMISSTWSDDEELDDAIKDMKKTEKEALLTVGIIRKYLGKPIFDSKKETERPLCKRDIVILMKAVKNRGDIFYKVLMENNIPCFVDDNKGYFDTIEINTFMSLLSVIDNHKQDVELLTVMRSEILGFAIGELAEIRAAHKEGSFYSSLKAYSEEGEKEDLRSRCREALEKISGWQNMARVMPLEELVWKLMVDTGFYASMGAMPGGTVRQANLRLLADKVLDYRKNQGSGLYGFIGYVGHIKEKDINMGQARVISEDEDTVRIMSIHRSKGLEFPMVIISDYARGPVRDKSAGGMVTDKELGIGLPYVRHDENWFKDTLLQRLIRRKAGRREVNEGKRVLYVAMTRAQDILVITCPQDDPEEALEKVRVSVPKDSSYFDMTAKIIAGRPGRVRIIEDRELSSAARMKKRSAAKVVRLLDSAPGTPDPETDRIMSYTYPHRSELMVKSKYSVSELNLKDHIPEMTFDPAVPREPEKYGLSAAHIGTVTHSVLEKADFGALSSRDPEEIREALHSLVKEMVDDEYLTADEGSSVNIDRLADFISSDLGKRIGEAQLQGALQREKPFNIRMEVEGEDALVQGIIDCFFIEGDSIVLVDYKTTAPRNVPGVRERYRVQMDIYRKACEESLGLRVSESYLYLTNLGLTVDMDSEG